MAAPKTVTLFLMDGSPVGRIKCSLTNWVGKVFLVPRTELMKSKDRTELNQTGVYILIGDDPETGEEKAYIGQARERKNGNGVLGRIAEHFKEEKLDYFTHAIIIVTSDDSFGPTEISFLENALYQRALLADRTAVVNGNDPSPGKVTEEKQAELDEFLDFAMIAIGSLGYRLFDVVEQTPPKNAMLERDSVSEPTLYLQYAGVRGEGRQTPEGFVVFAGSQLRADTTSSMPKSAKNRREELADRIENGTLTKDTLFSSPTAAASFLTGSSINGKANWKNSAGVALGDIENAEWEKNA